MSEWDSWVDYVLGHTANNYYENAPPDNAGTWHIHIGGHDGSCYAKSAGFDHVFDTSEIEKMSRAVVDDATDIFTAPPKGFSIVKNVPATSEFNVLTGKSKAAPSRQLYVARCTTTLVIALVDINNCNRGVEGIALSAIVHGITEGINAGI